YKTTRGAAGGLVGPPGAAVPGRRPPGQIERAQVGAEGVVDDDAAEAQLGRTDQAAAGKRYAVTVDGCGGDLVVWIGALRARARQRELRVRVAVTLHPADRLAVDVG